MKELNARIEKLNKQIEILEDKISSNIRIIVMCKGNLSKSDLNELEVNTKNNTHDLSLHKEFLKDLEAIKESLS